MTRMDTDEAHPVAQRVDDWLAATERMRRRTAEEGAVLTATATPYVELRVRPERPLLRFRPDLACEFCVSPPRYELHDDVSSMCPCSSVALQPLHPRLEAAGVLADRDSDGDYRPLADTEHLHAWCTSCGAYLGVYRPARYSGDWTDEDGHAIVEGA